MIQTVDLHGHTVHNGWKKFRHSTQQAYLSGKKSIIVVTGHGIMSREFSKWCEVDPYVTNCTNMNPNTGAWKVSIKRSVRSKKDRTPDTALDLTALYKKFNSR